MDAMQAVTRRIVIAGGLAAVAAATIRHEGARAGTVNIYGLSLTIDEAQAELARLKASADWLYDLCEASGHRAEDEEAHQLAATAYWEVSAEYRIWKHAIGEAS